MKPSPAFQFYPGDWLSSTDVMLMTPAEEGAYIRLLAYAWLQPDCGLPDDDSALSELSRLRSAWSKSGPKLRRKFFVIDGKLFNQRLLDERQKQTEWAEKSSAGGKRSATNKKARRNGAARVVQPPLEDGSTKGQPTGARVVQPKVNSSSSSSIKPPIAPLEGGEIVGNHPCDSGVIPGAFPLPPKGSPPVAPEVCVQAMRAAGWDGHFRKLVKANYAFVRWLMSDVSGRHIPDDMTPNTLSWMWSKLQWFTEFWQEYLEVRGAGKQDAMIAYFEMVDSLETHDRIMAALQQRKPAMLKSAEQYRKHGATLINGRFWEDDVAKTEVPESWLLN